MLLVWVAAPGWMYFGFGWWAKPFGIMWRKSEFLDTEQKPSDLFILFFFFFLPWTWVAIEICCDCCESKLTAAAILFEGVFFIASFHTNRRRVGFFSDCRESIQVVHNFSKIRHIRQFFLYNLLNNPILWLYLSWELKPKTTFSDKTQVKIPGSYRLICIRTITSCIWSVWKLYVYIYKWAVVWLNTLFEYIYNPKTWTADKAKFKILASFSWHIRAKVFFFFFTERILDNSFNHPVRKRCQQP